MADQVRITVDVQSDIVIVMQGVPSDHDPISIRNVYPVALVGASMVSNLCDGVAFNDNVVGMVGMDSASSIVDVGDAVIQNPIAVACRLDAIALIGIDGDSPLPVNREARDRNVVATRVEFYASLSLVIL